MMPSRPLIALGLAALLLAACGDIREDLGMGRNAPDEFAVVDRPPLSMPPEFDLRPPQPGAPRPQAVDLKERASNLVLGSAPAEGEKPSGLSDTEKALLEKTGGDKADPGIRQLVDHELTQKVTGSPHLVDELLWWKKDEQLGTTVDALAEAERIKEAKEKGEPINQGATPVIERQKSGWLGL